MLDGRLQKHRRRRTNRTIDAQLTRERRRTHTIDADAEFLECTGCGREEPENTDGSGDGRRARPDFVGGCGDVIATRGREISHRNHNRTLRSLERDELSVDLLRGRHATARAVDTQHERLDVLVESRLADELSGVITRNDPTTTATVDDLARADDHGDARIGVLRDFVFRANYAHIIFEVDRAIRLGLFVFRRQCDDALFDLNRRLERRNEFGIERNFGRVALSVFHLCRESVGISSKIFRLEASRLGHDAYVGLPKRVHERLTRLTVGRRHIVADVRFDRALVGADTEHIDVDTELVERRLVVVSIALVALEHHQTLRVEVELIRVRRNVIRVSRESETGCHDFLARLSEVRHRTREFIEGRLTRTRHVVELEHERLNSLVILGGCDGIGEVAQGRLTTAQPLSLG